jgi:superfamily II DNA or RNA helicase
MLLARRYSPEVPKRIRNRGRHYFSAGAVQILEASATRVIARVRGDSRYDVVLEASADGVRVRCTCPYFAREGNPCKHVWATILAADDAGHLQDAVDAGRPAMAVDSNEVLVDAIDDVDDGGDFEEEDFEEWDPDEEVPAEGIVPWRSDRTAAPESWRDSLLRVRAAFQPALGEAPWPPGKEIVYAIDLDQTRAHGRIAVEVFTRRRTQKGDWSKLSLAQVSAAQIKQLPNEADREILGLLQGASASPFGWYPSYASGTWPTRFRLVPPLSDILVPRMCGSGRCFRLVRGFGTLSLEPLAWDSGPPWEFWIEVAAGDGQLVLAGSLRRGEERLALSEALCLFAGGLVFTSDRAARLDDSGAFPWISLLREKGSLAVPASQKEDFLAELFGAPRLPRIDLPRELAIEEVAVAPRPRLVIRAPRERFSSAKRLEAELSFDYSGMVLAEGDPGAGRFVAETRRRIVRDRGAERQAAERLLAFGFRAPRPCDRGETMPPRELAPRRLPEVVRALIAEGWHVEAEGKLYRQPGAVRVAVSSGIDWFELEASVDYGERAASFPELLAAARRGEQVVPLGDGTFGLLPERWLERYRLLAGLGKAEDGKVRFGRSQTVLLDALLAAEPEASFDTGFAAARDEMRHFAGVEPADPSPDFVGTLRPYQREGLGWMGFLERFGFGGCLADDMGLGKTVQVLALLDARRHVRASRGEDPGPSALVVSPRSLVFNWKAEAERFAPRLRILDHTGVGRERSRESFSGYDVVLTTYGTLRRDAPALKEHRFSWVILDEAQAIKNASAASAKAARLLRADHRLALSGTPVENHLGEIWSLFEFLNPGMLGSATSFGALVASGREGGHGGRAVLAQALRPFFLRRTKEQVAPELPPRTEQTIRVVLDQSQRRRYDELRDHYRRSLHQRIERDGLARSKIQVLEALLRLRQAACHPGLVDPSKAEEPCAKFESLLPTLEEVLDEGHKALVFSQFTSFLAILRARLDRAGIAYEYLDGQTRDRAARVERFQSGDDCRLFLVSLKAGGLGLNLTAAEYVFLLDPWWNPAVEAQAVDRAHRIGQTQQVFAYRLIARDTVEEKVLELQRSKRELAREIFTGENALVRDLSREDLEMLLS